MRLALLAIGASLVATAAAAQNCPYGYYAANGRCYSIQQPQTPQQHPNGVAPQQGGGVNPFGPQSQVNGGQQYVVQRLPDGRLVYVPVR